ncbi:MAG: RNA polymerase sigma factor [Dehalococcoidia bacterium]
MDDVPMALVNPRVGHFETLSASRERSLVQRAREMDESAWDELYALHYGAIRRYAEFRVADASVADDIAAEVFLEAVRGIAKYRYRGIAFRAWLYRIAHNLTADVRKRLATRSDCESPDPEALHSVSQSDFAPGLERRRDIQAAVALLTDEQQQVVILRFFEGLSLAETAEATGRNSGAIKSLQHRALERLRLILGEAP